MRVVLISQDFFPLKGGISKYLIQIYHKYLKNTYFEAIIPDNIGKKKDFAELPFKVHKLRFAPFGLESDREVLNKKFIKLLKKIQPDIILFGYLRSHSEIGEEYKKINPKIKYGIIVHGKETFIDSAISEETNIRGFQKGYTKKEAEFYKEILQKADFIFSISRFTKQNLRKQGITNRIYVLPPYIDPKEIKIDKEARTKLGFDNSNFIILSVGRLIDRKGHELVIKAISNLVTEIEHIKYLIIGDGPKKKELFDLIKRLHLEKQVFIYDYVDDSELSKFYSSCDIFVLLCKFIPPNDIEGFGLVFLEAGAYMGCVIGGDTGGVKEAIRDNQTGYLINPDSLRDLENKIKLLYHDPRLREKMGRRGQLRVMKEFQKEEDDFLIGLFGN